MGSVGVVLLSADPARLSCSLCKDVKLCKSMKFFLLLPCLLTPISYRGQASCWKLSWNGCFLCPPPVWQWWQSELLWQVLPSALHPRGDFWGDRTRTFPNGRRPSLLLPHSDRIRVALPPLCSTHLDWTAAVQRNGDLGKGRNIPECKWQHSWVGRGLIQYQGGEGQEWERIILFQFWICPGLLLLAVIYVSFAHVGYSSSDCPISPHISQPVSWDEMSVPYLGTAGQLSSPGHSCQMTRYGLQIWGAAECCPWPAEWLFC